MKSAHQMYGYPYWRDKRQYSDMNLDGPTSQRAISRKPIHSLQEWLDQEGHIFTAGVKAGTVIGLDNIHLRVV